MILVKHRHKESNSLEEKLVSKILLISKALNQI